MHGTHSSYIVPDVEVLMERITPVDPGTVVGNRVCRHYEVPMSFVELQEAGCDREVNGYRGSRRINNGW